jgi:diguanylate cyclase (GGDEF)-like protein
VSEHPPRGSGDLQGDRHRLEEEQRWLARFAEEQRRAAEDQTASDADQTASDADQTTSDLERELSERDQLASDRDQLASDRDQAVSDTELELHPDDATRHAHEAGRAGRRAGTEEREQATHVRAVTGEERVLEAAKRDETAWRRDVTAQARDNAADRRDHESAALEREMESRGASLLGALQLAARTRARAAEDRARAAEDRRQAALDRRRAAKEREEVLEELRRAHRDALTGALRRGAGEVALQGEIDRARRADGKLVLAFVDVDSLRGLNNREGHVAGDALLRDVASAMRSKLRSYEPVVRFGGDEFVCAIGDVDLNQAKERFEAVQSSVAASSHGGGISVGLAELRSDDTLGTLIERADRAMLDIRRTRHRRVG